MNPLQFAIFINQGIQNFKLPEAAMNALAKLSQNVNKEK